MTNILDRIEYWHVNQDGLPIPQMGPMKERLDFVRPTRDGSLRHVVVTYARYRTGVPPAWFGPYASKADAERAIKRSRLDHEAAHGT